MDIAYIFSTNTFVKTEISSLLNAVHLRRNIVCLVATFACPVENMCGKDGIRSSGRSHTAST